MTELMPTLLGLGLAKPAHDASQAQLLALGRATTLDDPAHAALIEGLYARAGVDRRASVLLNSVAPNADKLDQTFYAPESEGNWPTTAQRMRAFDASATPLALHAARAAMAEASVSADQITDLITVSCTGLGSPGVDVALMTGLGLAPDVRRVNIGFMGCHGAIVAMRTSVALASAPLAHRDRPPRVLAVCIELCSLHLQRTTRMDRHVSNALFADGCAAMVIGSVAAQLAGTNTPSQANRDVQMVSTQHRTQLRIVGSTSMLFPGSTSAMGWQIGDHGFEMTLDRSVPALLQRHLGDWVWPWLRSHLGSTAGPGDVRWAIHPGGPRILDAVATALALTNEQTRDSRAVLRDHGNMSSPTVLFILDQVRAQPDDSRPIVMLAFGPGLTGEAALVQPISQKRA